MPANHAPGFLLIDRHIEKNAGSTFRELLWKAESNGRCMYMGYMLRSAAWNGMLAAMRNLTSESLPPRVCVEAHTGIDQVTPWLQRLEDVDRLRAELALRSVPMLVLLLLRLRNPLSFYISFFLWAVAERQAKAPAKFGDSFEQWLRNVPNLQSELVLSSKAAATAGYAPLWHKEIVAWRERWSSGAASERSALVWRTVRKFDVLGVTDMFDESNLLVARALGWNVEDVVSPLYPHEMPQAGASCSLPNLIRAHARRSQRGMPWWCRDPWKEGDEERLRVAIPHHTITYHTIPCHTVPYHSIPYHTIPYHTLLVEGDEERLRVEMRVCPNRSACEALVSRVAPLDVALYAHARQRMGDAIRAAGPEFSEQLVRLRSFKKRIQPVRCEWMPIRPTVIASRTLERKGRQRVLEAAPNFTSADACVPGDQEVMRAVWAEHGRGGRAKQGWPLQALVKIGSSGHRGKGLAIKLTEDEKVAKMFRQATGRVDPSFIPPRYRTLLRGRGV